MSGALSERSLVSGPKHSLFDEPKGRVPLALPMSIYLTDVVSVFARETLQYAHL